MNEAVVLDASAVLALMDGEPGQDAVAAVLPGALFSAVNLAEVVSKAGVCASGAGADHGSPVGERIAKAIGVKVLNIRPQRS